MLHDMIAYLFEHEICSEQDLSVFVKYGYLTEEQKKGLIAKKEAC